MPTKSWKLLLEEVQELNNKEKYQLVINKLTNQTLTPLAYRKAELFVERGKSYWRLKDYKKALNDFHTAKVLKPDYPPIYNSIGNVKYDLKEYDEALRNYDEAIKLDPQYIFAIRNRARARYLLGQYELAIKSYESAILLDPSNVETYNNLGNCFWALGKYNEAINYYTQSIKLNPEYYLGYYGRGNSYQKLDKKEEAIKDYNQAIKINPQYANAYNGKGNALKFLGDFNDALKNYTLAISLSPNSAMFYNNRGIVYRLKVKYKEALKDYNKAIHLNNDTLAKAYAYNNRGALKEYENNYEGALRDYNKSIKVKPTYDSVYKNRGRLLERFNRFEEALLDYHKAIELDPNDNYVKQLRDELLLKISNPITDELDITNIQHDIEKLINEITEIVKVKDNYIEKCQIAHYTKTSVADILLCESDKLNSTNITFNKNGLLRYYNASYMNDPTEGRILLDFLGEDDEIKYAFEQAELAEDSTIYIGSFVEVNDNNPSNSHDDDLFLWRTYGKDDLGIEARGCCLVFSPSLFDKHNEPLDPSRTNVKQALYKVRYIHRSNKKIIGENAEELEKKFKELEKKICDLLSKKAPKKTASEKEKDKNNTINKYIYRELSKIRYFFKWADYEYEKELRVVHEAPMGSELINFDIRDNGKTKLLYVNSNRPVIGHINKIILGTKVLNPDNWIYLSAIMAQYYKDKGITDRKFELRRSKSPFR